MMFIYLPTDEKSKFLSLHARHAFIVYSFLRLIGTNEIVEFKSKPYFLLNF